MSDEKIHEKLKALRENNGFTQEQMGDFLRMHRTTYTKIENGQTRLSLELAGKLTKLFQVDIKEFMESEHLSPVAYAGENEKRKPAKIPEKFSHTYDLQKDELTLVGHLRTMSEEEKKALFEFLENLTKKP